jgi:acyl-CoA thioesterase-1
MKRKSRNTLRWNQADGPVRRLPPPLIFFMAAFIALGTATLVLTHAATSVVSFEPERGVISTKATTGSDNTASGGSYVAFGTSSQPIKIMPLGDSITYGYNGGYSYRYYLIKQLKAAGFNNFDMVGSLTSDHQTGDVWDQDNEGHIGWTNSMINDNIPYWVSLNKPDIVLIHTGTNGGTVAEVGQIIDKIRAANPTVVILLAEIIPDLSVNNDFHTYNAGLVTLGSQKTTAQSPIIMVDLNTGFDTAHWYSDNEHPNALGDTWMAGKWYTALTPFL